MANKNKERAPLTIRDVTDRLQDIGYQPVAVPDTPRDLTVFQAPTRIKDLRRLGVVIPRTYAVCPLGDLDLAEGNFMIGWSHVIGGKDSLADAARLAVSNCLGRRAFLVSCPDITASYLNKIVGKFADSISAQALVRPEN